MPPFDEGWGLDRALKLIPLHSPLIITSTTSSNRQKDKKRGQKNKSQKLKSAHILIDDMTRTLNKHTLLLHIQR